MNRNDFFDRIKNLPTEELERIQCAYWLSKDVHRTQTRDTGERYFNHPRRVALQLIDAGYTDSVVLALLHDAIEDTNVPFRVIIRIFGADTWKDLLLLSKAVSFVDPVTGQTIGHVKKETEAYYGELMSAPKHVRLVKLADRLDNLSDMANFTPERKAKYIQETEKYVIPLAKTTCLNFWVKICNAMTGEETT